jgi:AraC-like DNA-binding protein
MEYAGNHLDFSVNRVVGVIERVTDKSWKMVRSSHSNCCVLCAALSGEAEYQFYDGQQEPVHVQAGDIMFFNRECERSARTIPENPWHFITVMLDVKPMNEESEAFLQTSPAITCAAPRKVLELFSELSRVWEGKGTAYAIKCRSLAEEILYELLRAVSITRQNSIHYETVESIRQYIQMNYNRNFLVEELADMAHCSPSHFRMLFKQAVGMTANQYIATVRIGKAKDLLLSGEMNVSEAADAVGYRDVFYFSRQFKAVTGHPPSFYIP